MSYCVPLWACGKKLARRVSPMKTRRLTKKEMRIFAVGQLGWSILGGLINAWLVTFYLPT